ncbi:unnamed protein product, partial [Ectocarpus sp. 8 AP-2014]
MLRSVHSLRHAMHKEGGCRHRANANKQTRTATSPEVFVMPTRDCYQTPTRGGHDRHNMAGDHLTLRLLYCSGVKGDPSTAFWIVFQQLDYSCCSSAFAPEMMLVTQSANIATTPPDYTLFCLSWVRVDTR